MICLDHTLDSAQVGLVNEVEKPAVDVSGHIDVGGEVGVRGAVGVGGHVRVSMERTELEPTPDEALWEAIRERSEALGFDSYREYIGGVFGLEASGLHFGGLSRRLGELGARGVGTYQMLRDLTELFVLSESGWIDDRAIFRDNDVELKFRPRRSHAIAEKLGHYLRNGELPYIDRVVKAAYPSLDPECVGLDGLRTMVLRKPLFLELWHEMCLEHGMLMRTMEAISSRFQNIQLAGENDGLANYESSPLRSLSDWFWGFNQDLRRLNARRRIQEYKHQYGPTALDGAVADLQAADVRTAFPGVFMNLLNICDIDQAWRLSRLCGGGGGAVGGFRRQTAPRRRGGADRLQRRNRFGIGAHEHAAFRAGADVAAG